MEFNLAKKEAKFDLRLAYALFQRKSSQKKHNSYWTTKQSVWHSKFQLYELLQYLFPEFKEHLSFQEFSLARNMLNWKLILQTGTSDYNSAKCPECEKILSNTIACPNCGQLIKRKRKKEFK